jgi:hypothetical protein
MAELRKQAITNRRQITITLILVAILASASTLSQLIHHVNDAELSENDLEILMDIFQQDDLLRRLNIDEGMLLVRGEVKGKSYADSYNVDNDAYGVKYCGALPAQLAGVIKGKHPNLYSQSWYYGLKSHLKVHWIAIWEIESKNGVRATVGHMNGNEGISVLIYYLTKDENGWNFSEVVGVMD